MEFWNINKHVLTTAIFQKLFTQDCCSKQSNIFFQRAKCTNNNNQSTSTYLAYWFQCKTKLVKLKSQHTLFKKIHILQKQFWQHWQSLNKSYSHELWPCPLYEPHWVKWYSVLLLLFFKQSCFCALRFSLLVTT